jgi:hypothetical protein
MKKTLRRSAYIFGTAAMAAIFLLYFQVDTLISLILLGFLTLSSALLPRRDSLIQTISQASSYAIYLYVIGVSLIFLGVTGKEYSFNKSGYFEITGLLLVIIFFSANSVSPRNTRNHSSQNARDQYKHKTNRDKLAIASHESGHALIHALALPCLPKSFSLSVDDMEGSDSAGHVSMFVEEHRHQSATFVEFHLMVLLAGRASEDILLGGHTGGSQHDLNKWMEIASAFGPSCLNLPLYPDPKTQVEAQANLTTLAEYQEKQYRSVWRLLEENEDVLVLLRDRALNEGTLTSEQLIPFLKRVKIPPGYPLITEGLLGG